MNTKSIYYTALTAISAVGTTIAQIFGGWDTALQTLVIFMAVDYITGILCAIIWKKSPKTADGAFESKASIKGL
ncbi:MAG: phage holin family protein, partial [Oscillospiraceae bacterium]